MIGTLLVISHSTMAIKSRIALAADEEPICRVLNKILPSYANLELKVMVAFRKRYKQHPDICLV